MTSKERQREEPLIRKKNQTRKKNISTKSLVRKALKNRPKWKPSEGLKYLEDIPIGSTFILNKGTGGILLNTNPAASTVLIIRSSCAHTDADERYYLGRQRWGSKTEVKQT